MLRRTNVFDMQIDDPYGVADARCSIGDKGCKHIRF